MVKPVGARWSALKDAGSNRVGIQVVIETAPYFLGIEFHVFHFMRFYEAMNRFLLLPFTESNPYCAFYSCSICTPTEAKAQPIPACDLWSHLSDLDELVSYLQSGRE